MTILHFAKNGVLIQSTINVLLGEGPVELIPQEILPIQGPEEKLQFGNIIVTRHAFGVRLILPDATLEYLHAPPKKLTEHACNVLIIHEGIAADRLIKTIKPQLTIMHNGTLDWARERQKKTGVQTIATDESTIVDLAAYSAISPQHRLV